MRHKVWIWVLGYLFGASLVLGAGQWETLRNQEGIEIKCRILKVADGLVSMEREDGQKFDFEIEKLDKESQAIVEKKRQEMVRPQLEVILLRNEVIDVVEEGQDFMHVSMSDLERRTDEGFEFRVHMDKPGESRYVLTYYIFNGDVMMRGRHVVILKDGNVWTKRVGADTENQKIGKDRYVNLRMRGIELRTRLSAECVAHLTETNGTLIDEYVSSQKCAELISRYPDILK